MSFFEELGKIGSAFDDEVLQPISDLASSFDDAVTNPILTAVKENPELSLMLAGTYLYLNPSLSFMGGMPEAATSTLGGAETLGGIDAAGNVLSASGADIGAANSLADFAGADAFPSFTADYGLGGGNYIPQLKVTSDPTKFLDASEFALGPVDYSLNPVPVGNPAAIGDAAMNLPSQPALNSMNGAQGMSTSAFGRNGVEGTVGARGFTPLDAVPDLGDPKSFINNPAVTGASRLMSDVAPTSGWQDALKNVGNLLGEIGGVGGGKAGATKGGLGDFGSLKFGESFLPGSSYSQPESAMVKLKEQAIIPALMAVLQQRGMNVNQPNYADGGEVRVSPINDTSNDYLIDNTDPYTQMATKRPSSLSSMDYLDALKKSESSNLFSKQQPQFGYAHGGSIRRFADGGSAAPVDYSDPSNYQIKPTTIIKPLITSPLNSAPIINTGGGVAPTSNAEGGAKNMAALEGLVSMMPSQESINNAINNFKPMIVQVMEAIKSIAQNSNIGMSMAHNALSQANAVNGLSPAAVAMGGLGMANANQGIAAANAASTGGASSVGTSPGTAGGGLAGMGSGALGVANSAAAGNVGVASAAGPGSSGGGGGGGGGNGSGASSAGGSSAGSAYSDIRMKDNIKPIEGALSKVHNLDGITFDMGGKRGTGLAAQQLEKVLPEVVHKDPNGLRKVDYGNVVGLLVEAVKELDHKTHNKSQGGALNAYAGGGSAHRPEFITGKTGHYAQGRGTGQSDDIPAVLHDGDYVVDADTVAAFGDGSSKAGAGALEQFRKSLPEHHSGGGQPIRAQIADGEYVLPAGFVTSLGRGSNKDGAKMLDAMREEIRAHKRSAPDTKIPPKAKKPVQYMREAMKG